MALMSNTFRTLFRARQDDDENSHGDTASSSMTGEDNDSSLDADFLIVEEHESASENENKCDSELLKNMTVTQLDDGDITFQPKESPMESMAVTNLDDGDSAFQPKALPVMCWSSSNTKPNVRYNIKVPDSTEVYESPRQRVDSLPDTRDLEGHLGPTHPPVSLHFLGDEEVLSPYECLLRKNIEFFGADPLDIRTRLGQVGIRCRNCAHLDRNVRGDSMEFPRRYEDLCPSAKRLACHMIQSCDFVSTTLKEELTRLSKLPIALDSNYWAEAAKESGVLPGLEWNEWSPRVREPSFGRRQLHKQYYNYHVGRGLSNRKRSLT
jgi:hypothetical protein